MAERLCRRVLYGSFVCGPGSNFDRPNGASSWNSALPFSPMLFSSISIGTRIASVTPRLTSELLMNAVFMLICFDLGLGNWEQVACAAVLIAGLILTSKFGLQAILFIIPVTTIITMSSDLLLAVILGATIPIVLSGGEVSKMIRRQIEHLFEYYKNNVRSPNETTGRNDFSKIIVKSRSSLCGINLSATIWNVIATNSYTSVFFKFPLMLAVLTMSLYACALGGIVFDPMLFTPIAVASIVYLLVNQRKLLFLGEVERYLNHIVVIIIVCAIDLANQLNVAWVLWGILYTAFFTG